MKRFSNKVSMMVALAILLIIIVAVLVYIFKLRPLGKADSHLQQPADFHYVSGTVTVQKYRFPNQIIGPAAGFTIVIGGIGKTVANDGKFSMVIQKNGCLDVQFLAKNSNALYQYQQANKAEQQVCFEVNDRNPVRDFVIEKIP